MTPFRKEKLPVVATSETSTLLVGLSASPVITLRLSTPRADTIKSLYEEARNRLLSLSRLYVT